MVLAESRAKEPRTDFAAETYTPPEPYIFVPSGVDSYVPRRENYDAELVLRDPEEHLVRTWDVGCYSRTGTVNSRTRGIKGHMALGRAVNGGLGQ